MSILLTMGAAARLGEQDIVGFVDWREAIVLVAGRGLSYAIDELAKLDRCKSRSY